MPAPGKSKKKSIEKNQTPIRNFFKPVSKDDKQEKLKTIPFDESGLDVKEDLREDEKENGGANRDDRYVYIFRINLCSQRYVYSQKVRTLCHAISQIITKT